MPRQPPVTLLDIRECAEEAFGWKHIIYAPQDRVIFQTTDGFRASVHQQHQTWEMSGATPDDAIRHFRTVSREKPLGDVLGQLWWAQEQVGAVPTMYRLHLDLEAAMWRPLAVFLTWPHPNEPGSYDCLWKDGSSFAVPCDDWKAFITNSKPLAKHPNGYYRFHETIVDVCGVWPDIYLRNSWKCRERFEFNQTIDRGGWSIAGLAVMRKERHLKRKYA